MISITLEYTKSSQQAKWLQYTWWCHMSIMWPSTHTDHVMMSHDFNFIWYPYQSCDHFWQQTTVHSTCCNVTWVSCDLVCVLITWSHFSCPQANDSVHTYDYAAFVYLHKNFNVMHVFQHIVQIWFCGPHISHQIWCPHLRPNDLLHPHFQLML